MNVIAFEPLLRSPLLEAERFLDERRLTLAIDHFNLAESCGEDRERCASGRWMADMLGGNFHGAWKESDAIQRRGVPDLHRFWQGEGIDGKRLMVRCLHGFGDAVQFFRYAPRLNERTAEVIWEVAPEFKELAKCFRGVDRVVSWHQDQVVHSEWDVQVEVMELPFLFRTEIAELPIATNYLHLPSEMVDRVKASMQYRKAPRVGLVWAAGEWNASRSLPVALLQSLIQNVDCEFWNLQGGRVRRELYEFYSYGKLRDIEECNSGVLALAGVISQMDLVITVDTLAAHLAGALDIPAWLMLQYAADWRWMVNRSDSPWYPSIRIFRQPSAGDWSGVVHSVDTALRRWSDAQLYQ